MRMREFDGKKLVALARDADYAHAGEEVAIEIVFDKFSKDPKRSILDVGCGLGGTAHYLQKFGWGNVTGVDIDHESICYAKEKYAEISFYAGDVIDLPNMLSTQFDLICLFKSFYAFKDQDIALRAMRSVANNNSKLVIYDSIHYRPVENHNRKDFFPIIFPGFEKRLANAGWKLSHCKKLGNEYELWYSKLLQKIFNKQEIIIKVFGKESFEYAVNTYATLVKSIKDGVLGGIIIYADAEF